MSRTMVIAWVLVTACTTAISFALTATDGSVRFPAGAALAAGAAVVTWAALRLEYAGARGTAPRWAGGCLVIVVVVVLCVGKILTL